MPAVGQTLDEQIFESEDFVWTEAEIRGKGVGPKRAGALEEARQWSKFPVSVTTGKPSYKIGEEMDIVVKADSDCSIVVYYTDSQGESVVICPSPFSSNNQLKAGVPFFLRDTKGEKLVQTGPPGEETIQVIALTEGNALKEQLEEKKGWLEKLADGALQVINPPGFVKSIAGWVKDKIFDHSKGVAQKEQADSSDRIYGFSSVKYSVTE